MSYLPLSYNLPSPRITYMSPESISVAFRNTGNSTVPASATWPTANKALYTPFSIRTTITVYSLFVANGATASNSFDIGIYSSDGRKIVSTGSTAQSGTNTIQTVALTGITLGPGQYYLAMAMSGNTGTTFSSNYNTRTQVAQLVGTYQQTSAFPLPTTATFASNVAVYIPLCGIQTTPTGSATPLLMVNLADQATTSENHTP